MHKAWKHCGKAGSALWVLYSGMKFHLMSQNQPFYLQNLQFGNYNIVKILEDCSKPNLTFGWHFSFAFTTRGRLILHYMILFTVRVVSHWNRLSGGSVDALTLEAFKARMLETWSKLV